MNKERLIPLIVATALFMENMDSTVIATSLPAIAADIGTSPLTRCRPRSPISSSRALCRASAVR
jgi:hypothetical protein